MNRKWTNLILHTSALIQKKKNSLITSHALKALADVFAIIFLEIFLAIISLPEYALVSYETKGKAGVHYRIRKVITLSLVGVILLIWLIKIALISITPIYLGTSNEFLVLEERTISALEAENDFIFTDIHNANINSELQAPEIEELTIKDKRLTIKGRGQADSYVSLYLSRQGAQINDVSGANLYLEPVGRLGKWEITDIGNGSFDLKAGSYWVTATTYNDQTGEKTPTVVAGTFQITDSILDSALDHFDRYLNYFLIFYFVMSLLALIIISPKP